MNICLIRYHNRENMNTRLPERLNKAQGVYQPLGIAYIAAVLETNGFDVEIIDAIALNLTKQEFTETIKSKKPHLVGITCMTPSVRGSLEAAQICKEAGAIVVVGGAHLTSLYKETLSYDFVDYGILGEGEYSFLELAQALEKKRTVEKVGGCVYKKDGNIIANEPRIVEELDELPFPARHMLPMGNYTCIIAEEPFTTIVSGRGCPFQCGFCSKQPSDKRYRTRSARNIVDEMQECIKKYKIKEFMFYDDTITFNREHIISLCHEILRRNLDVKWESPTRLDCVDKEIISLMKKAGCIRLRYGVESGDKRITRLMRKNIDLKKAKDIFKFTKKIGIETFAYFMVGYYSETAQSMRNTIKFAKELIPDWAMFTITTPLPDTHLFDLCVNENLVDKNYWINFTLRKVNRRIPYLMKDANEWIRRAYFQFYFRPFYMLKKMMKVTSFESFKKMVKGMIALTGV